MLEVEGQNIRIMNSQMIPHLGQSRNALARIFVSGGSEKKYDGKNTHLPMGAKTCGTVEMF